VPQEWVFKDDGYRGATLERPGLEHVRDLTAEGQIQVVLAYSPDHLSRKYAHQIHLIEELARNGVETLFVKASQGSSAEDQLFRPCYATLHIGTLPISTRHAHLFGPMRKTKAEASFRQDWTSANITK
jgi:DNA invertase Pin-like site-specific DNA recombinase